MNNTIFMSLEWIVHFSLYSATIDVYLLPVVDLPLRELEEDLLQGMAGRPIALYEKNISLEMNSRILNTFLSDLRKISFCFQQLYMYVCAQISQKLPNALEWIVLHYYSCT